jgi:hypothetical protein
VTAISNRLERSGGLIFSGIQAGCCIYGSKDHLPISILHDVRLSATVGAIGPLRASFVQQFVQSWERYATSTSNPEMLHPFRELLKMAILAMADVRT